MLHEVLARELPRSLVRSIKRGDRSASLRVSVWERQVVADTLDAFVHRSRLGVSCRQRSLFASRSLDERHLLATVGDLRRAKEDHYRAYMYSRIICHRAGDPMLLFDLLHYRRSIMERIPVQEQSILHEVCRRMLSGAEAVSTEDVARRTGVRVSEASTLLGRLARRGLIDRVAGNGKKKASWKISDVLFLAGMLELFPRIIRHDRVEYFRRIGEFVEEARRMVLQN